MRDTSPYDEPRSQNSPADKTGVHYDSRRTTFRLEEEERLRKEEEERKKKEEEGKKEKVRRQTGLSDSSSVFIFHSLTSLRILPSGEQTVLAKHRSFKIQS